MNQASHNLAGNLVSSNPTNNFVQNQQNRYATPGSTNQFLQGNTNVQSNIQGQQYLSPNRLPQLSSPPPLSYPSQPRNPGQFGTLQNNIQRVIGAPTGTQTSIQSAQSRNIETQYGRFPSNINTTHIIDSQPATNFNGSSKI